jgi:hypothetical protein
VCVGIWNDTGYPEPLPFEGAHPIPPLSQCSAGNIKAAHGAIEAIEELIRDLHAVRAQLVTEIRAGQDEGAVRVDKALAESRARQGQASKQEHARAALPALVQRAPRRGVRRHQGDHPKVHSLPVKPPCRRDGTHTRRSRPTQTRTTATPPDTDLAAKPSKLITC